MYCYRSLHDLDKALLDADVLLRINPNCFEALCVRGIIYKLRGKYNEAYLDLKRSLDIKPDLAESSIEFCHSDMTHIDYDAFQDIRLLDEGGFGEIFQATSINDLGKQIKVALKYLKSSKDFSIDIANEIHERGLIHRDLHSKNILICENGDQELTKIGDLGLATFANELTSKNKIY
ncbi:9024_t:CDS:2, partial [Racocetra fulgida]